MYSQLERLKRLPLFTYKLVRGDYVLLPDGLHDFTQLFHPNNPERSTGYLLELHAQGKFVGGLSFTERGTRIRAKGTWIDKHHRHLGYGRELWHFLLLNRGTTHVSVSCITKGGYALMRAVEDAHPQVKFDIEVFT